MSDSNPTSDLVMMFTDKNGAPVWAESTLSVLTTDPFMAGFIAAPTPSDYSNFFEIQSFNFSMVLSPEDKGTGALSQKGPTSGANGMAPAAQDQFSAWRSATLAQAKDMPFPIEFDNFSFTRVIDGASPGLFAACCNQESFRHAALVRRAAVGALGGAQQNSVGFLRIDFRHVLLTAINWSDGDLVTESVTFICKAMRIRYSRQRPDGQLLPTAEAEWDQQKDGPGNTGGAT